MIQWTETQYGIVLGRMQPLHIGHLEYLEAARSRCDRLVIGVTNPDVGNLLEDIADPKRSRPENNPFTYFDRHEMIASSMVERGWTFEDFAVVPADINRPNHLITHLPPPSVATVFVTVYDDWGDRKSELLANLGYKVEVLWRRSMDDRVTSGTALRHAMRIGGPWRHLVPGAVVRYLDETGLSARFPEGFEISAGCS